VQLYLRIEGQHPSAEFLDLPPLADMPPAMLGTVEQVARVGFGLELVVAE
jgi:hypothetical protein